jgi:hypothetical protein
MSHNFTLDIGPNIEITEGEFKNLDVIICNNTANTDLKTDKDIDKEADKEANKSKSNPSTNFKKENFNMKCYNYRKVRKLDKIDNNPIDDIDYYVKIASLNISSLDPTSEDGGLTGKKYFDFITKNCFFDETVTRIKDLYTADNNCIAYFNPVDIIYHINTTNVMKDEIELNAKYLEIYKNATRGLMIYAIKKMKEIGIKVIIIDPKIRWHPSMVGPKGGAPLVGTTAFDVNIASTTPSAREHINNLIELYESMGLKKINCYFATNMMSEVEIKGTTPLDKRELRKNLNKPELQYDTAIMIGFIDDLYNIIDGFISHNYYNSLSATYGYEASVVKDYNAVPKYLIKNFNDKDVINEKEMEEIKRENKINMIGGYYKKYLKYKTKYLNLKLNK